MKIHPRLYISYLLRMWQTEEAGKLVWRASLENPQTGEMLFFASLPLLFEFLEKGGGTQDDCGSPTKAENDHDFRNRAPPSRNAK